MCVGFRLCTCAPPTISSSPHQHSTFSLQQHFVKSKMFANAQLTNDKFPHMWPFTPPSHPPQISSSRFGQTQFYGGRFTPIRRCMLRRHNRRSRFHPPPFMTLNGVLHVPHYVSLPLTTHGSKMTFTFPLFLTATFHM